MKILRVSKAGENFSTIQEAVDAVSYNEAAVIYVAKGEYREKIFIEKNNISIIGESSKNTVISWDDFAYALMDDGTKRGTFRSYTMFLSGENIVMKNISIKNTAGDGSIKGQSIAAYVDAKRAYFENVVFSSHQDTLFLAPLPKKEREKNGFRGPRVFSPRIPTEQYYKNCEIIGDIDFIFGGADAVFDSCKIISRNREYYIENNSLKDKEQVNGYIAAPCTAKDKVGFVFIDCEFIGEEGIKPETVYLARPWREYAKACFINCKYGEHISEKGFSTWKKEDEYEEYAKFVEYSPRDLDNNIIETDKRVSWAKVLTEKEIGDIYEFIEEIRKLFIKIN